MNNRYDSIIEALSKAGFVKSTADTPIRELDFKITEYNLNTGLSFKFENVSDFKDFLHSQSSTVDEERVDNTLNDLNIDSNHFFYVNFFEKDATNQQ